MLPTNQKKTDAEAIKKGMAKAHDNPGGKHSMSRLNPQKPDEPFNAPRFRGVRIHDTDTDSWGIKEK